MKSFVLVVLAGCLPVNVTQVRATGRHLGAVAIEPGPAKLTVDVAGGIALVTAVVPRRCRIAVIDELAIRDSTTLSLVGTQGGHTWGYWLLPGLLFPPAALAAAGISGAAILARPPHDETSHRSEVVARLDRACDTVAQNLPVRITLASGTAIDMNTNEHGQVIVLLPPGELGAVEARALGRAPSAPPPTPVATPAPTIGPPRDPVVATLMRTAIARMRAGDCVNAKRIGEQIRLRDPDYHSRAVAALLAECR